MSGCSFGVDKCTESAITDFFSPPAPGLFQQFLSLLLLLGEPSALGGLL